MRRKRRQVLLAAAGVILLLFFLTEFRLVVVHGDSMLPSYRNGQTVLVNQLSIFGRRWKRGEQSFAVVMLDEEQNGVSFSSVYSRNDVRVYAKAIKNGSGAYKLTEEEQKAMAL